MSERGWCVTYYGGDTVVARLQKLVFEPTFHTREGQRGVLGVFRVKKEAEAVKWRWIDTGD
jgi:hypothetical protein